MSVRRSMASTKLTPARWRVLEWYSRHPGASVREAAEALGISHAATHQHALKLGELGLVESEMYRARALRLTDAGRQAVSAFACCPTCSRPIATNGATS